MSSENGSARPRLSAWRFVGTFGAVSLLADFVYEGARSITGPLLASFGATALVVGVVTGIGEAAALGLRLVSGPLTDRTQRFWTWTITGYTLTIVTVPFLGFAGTLWVACTLVIAERVGKAIRSPAKDTLLSHATAVTGRGRGFAVHEAMDQIGAVIGPLTVAAVLSLTGGNFSPALGVLAVPGAFALIILGWLSRRVPDPAGYEMTHASHGPVGADHSREDRPRRGTPLPRAFWAYSAFTSTTMIGFSTFGVLSFHMVATGIMSAATVPLVYAAAMGADAVAALASGWAYDRIGAKTLVVLPIISALIPIAAFSDRAWLVVVGTLLWGAAVGIQESTLRAVVADLVPPARRATAYGVFAAGLGVATAAGGGLTGFLYEESPSALVATVVTIQALALTVAIAAFVARRRLPLRSR